MKTAKILCRSCYRRAAALNLLFAAVGSRAIHDVTRLYEGYTVYPRAAGAARPNTEREPRNRATRRPAARRRRPGADRRGTRGGLQYLQSSVVDEDVVDATRNPTQPW